MPNSRKEFKKVRFTIIPKKDERHKPRLLINGKIIAKEVGADRTRWWFAGDDGNYYFTPIKVETWDCIKKIYRQGPIPQTRKIKKEMESLLDEDQDNISIDVAHNHKCSYGVFLVTSYSYTPIKTREMLGIFKNKQRADHYKFTLKDKLSNPTREKIKISKIASDFFL